MGEWIWSGNPFAWLGAVGLVGFCAALYLDLRDGTADGKRNCARCWDGACTGCKHGRRKP